MNINIRRANNDDIKVLNAFLTSLIRDEKKYDKNINEDIVINYFYETIIDKEDHYLLVADVDNKLVGYLYGYIENSGNVYIDKVSVIDALFVMEEYRGNGIANMLIDEFKKVSKDNNVRYIEIKVCNENEKASSLYNKCGFKDIKRILQVDLEK